MKRYKTKLAGALAETAGVAAYLLLLFALAAAAAR